jgi:hypothetical protein
MLIDLQSHYLDLIVEGIASAGHACLLHKHASNQGRIYVTASETDTASLMVISFDFQDTAVRFGVEFRDGRGPLDKHVNYVAGLNDFLAVLMRALVGNRIADRRAA